MKGAALATVIGALAFGTGCGEDGSKYDRQYPQPKSEANMMRVLRTHTTPASARPRSSHERKESDTR
jgi:hypothetical protein